MLSLALAFIQDSSAPQQQQISNAAAGMGVVAVLFIILIVFALLAFVIFLLWRVFTKAGLNGALSLLLFVPAVGSLLVLCILAFADWKVVPIAQAAPLPPPYTPPPSYPPAPPSYPSSQPPTA
jgi:uncharacterized membrane protein YhaH (DUF805 family)